ncbi:MAG: hypothetical protein V4608_04810 [Bacteroidota bacterium]
MRDYKHISFFCCLIFCYSCSYDKAELNVDCVSPETVSFSGDIQPVLNTHCAVSGCHSGSSPAGNLNLEPSVAYVQLMNNSSGYVDTITPIYSVLHASMNSSSDPMPPTGKLDKCTVDLILKWIQQKAKNN